MSAIKKGYPRHAVNALWQMDSNQLNSVEIRNENNEFSKFQINSALDVGSRKVLAMDARFSESHTNTANLISEVLLKNQFRKAKLGESVDLQLGYAEQYVPGLLEAFKKCFPCPINAVFPKPGYPTDKSNIESFLKFYEISLENTILAEFSDKIEGTYQQSLVNRTITVTQLNIGLTELNASGVIQEFVDDYNEKRRTFHEDGRCIKFKPIDRWNEYLAEGDVFQINAESIAEINQFFTQPRENNMTVIKVNQDGIVYQGNRYYNCALKHYVGQDVNVELGASEDEIIVKSKGSFVCMAKVLIPIKKPEINDRVLILSGDFAQTEGYISQIKEDDCKGNEEFWVIPDASGGLEEVCFRDEIQLLGEKQLKVGDKVIVDSESANLRWDALEPVKATIVDIKFDTAILSSRCFYCVVADDLDDKTPVNVTRWDFKLALESNNGAH